MRTTVVLVDMAMPDGGHMYRALHFDDDGGLTIEGQDLGVSVGEVFGDGSVEYEFSRRLDSQACSDLARAMELGDQPLIDAMGALTSAEIETLIAKHAIASTFWSRSGP